MRTNQTEDHHQELVEENFQQKMASKHVCRESIRAIIGVKIGIIIVKINFYETYLITKKEWFGFVNLGWLILIRYSFI